MSYTIEGLIAMDPNSFQVDRLKEWTPCPIRRDRLTAPMECCD